MADYAKIDRDVLTRYEGNPVLQASDFAEQLGFKMRAVYNSSAIKTPDGRYVMLCRTNQLNHKTLLWGADSDDGLSWRLRPEPFAVPTDPVWQAAASTVYYDPRIEWLGQTQNPIGGNQHRPFHHVLKLTHVAGPGVAFEPPHDLRRDLVHVNAVLRGELPGEMAHELLDVGDPLAQRRHGDGVDIEAIEKILAETAGFDLGS